MAVAEGNVGLAWACVIIAGLCTTIGSTFAFCTDYANKSVLASCLGISAGVMLYVSFAEIFCIKSVEGFEASGYGNATAIRYSTFCFFAGVLTTYVLDLLVVRLAKLANPNADGHGHSHDFPMDPSDGQGKDGCDHAGNMHKTSSSTSLAVDFADVEMKEQIGEASEQGGPAAGMVVGRANAPAETAAVVDHELQQMGLLTGLAIALHNFPEGLATFVATLADSSLGISLTIAIAIHNIPEGICVAMPIYYATGSKWKGFLWSFLSGISEPIGGLIGYAALAGADMSDEMYGTLFGLVGGMMVYISVKELIPTALRYDPKDKYVSNSVIFGMAVMASSLLLFGVDGDDPEPTPCEGLKEWMDSLTLGPDDMATDTMTNLKLLETVNATYTAAGCHHA